MTTRLGFRARLVAGLVLAVAVTALAVGAISVPLARASLQEALRDDAIADTRTALTTGVDDVGLPDNPTEAELGQSGFVERLLARGVDGAWVEVPGQEPYLSSLALLAGPETVSSSVRATVEQDEIGWEFTSLAGTPVLVTGGQRPGDDTTVFLVTSTAAVLAVTTQLRQTILLVAVAVAVIGSLLAWALTNRLLRPVADAGTAARRMAAGDLDTTLPTGRDQFGQLGVAFNAMAASLQATITRLQEARDRERRFVADASHDLRTPVTGLVSAADLLADRLADADVDDDTRQLATIVDREATNLAHLVEGLLEVSRLGSDTEPEAPTFVALADHLQALAAMRVPTAVVTAPSDIMVALPTLAFDRIVGNLLDNARIHADAREVTVAAHLTTPASSDDSGDDDSGYDDSGDDDSGDDDGTVVGAETTAILTIDVADRGPGIPADQLERVFDRLATGSSDRGGGSGLGLAIARAHARRVGGELTAHVRVGGGTLMRLRLPVAGLLRDSDGTATSTHHDGGTG